jgi:hypothetical protein
VTNETTTTDANLTAASERLRERTDRTDDTRTRSTIELADDASGSPQSAFVQPFRPALVGVGRAAVAPPARSAGAVP